MAAVIETEARVALAAGEHRHARELAVQARKLAERSGNEMARLAAMVTEARSLRAEGDRAAAEEQFAAAARAAHDGRVPTRLREVLREWADMRADAGDHRGAYELTAEALTVN